MVAAADRAAIVSEGVAALLDGFNALRAADARASLSDDDAEIIAIAADDLHKALGERLPADWGQTTLSMIIGVGCKNREAGLVKEAVRRFMVFERVGRDEKWCSDELDALVVELMWEDPGWDFMDFEDKGATDEALIEMCESVGIENIGDDWIDAIRAFVGDETKLADRVGAVRGALARLRDLGEIPAAGDARDRAARAHLAARALAPDESDLVVTKVARALAERPLGIRLGGERTLEEWTLRLRAASLGERGLALLGDEAAPSELDWLGRLMAGSEGTADPCAVALWLEIYEELRSRAGSERALELLDMAEPMDILEDAREFSLRVPAGADVLDEFWKFWGAPLRVALARVLEGDCSVRVMDEGMRYRGGD